jgi:uncharacterized glyoxalase superfamily protein PhnB
MLHSISPFFIVRDVTISLAFYRDCLGFETRFQQPDEDPSSRSPGATTSSSS